MSRVLELTGESARVRRLARAVMDGAVSFSDYRNARTRIMEALLAQGVSPQSDLGLEGIVEPGAPGVPAEAAGDNAGSPSGEDATPAAAAAAPADVAPESIDEVFEQESASRLWLGLIAVGGLVVAGFLAASMLLS